MPVLDLQPRGDGVCLRPSAVRVVAGDASRRKLVSIGGLSPEGLLARIAG